MRRPIVAGNWKCHLTQADAGALAEQLLHACPTDAADVVVCPPFTALSTVGKILAGSAVALGAQDLFWEPQGAFTGEISIPMLVDVGCAYAIIGHSERRASFGETDETVRRKLAAALKSPLTPIVCIGETLADRDANRTFEVLTRQLSGALQGCAPTEAGTTAEVGVTEGSADRRSRRPSEVARIVLAYEPVWAIGTGRNATPEQAQEAHAFIRQWISRQVGVEAAGVMRIQYGGSVTAANAAGLLAQPDVDGALVGGASLNAATFCAIVKAADNTTRTQHTAHSTQREP